jgi:hypothetical protein
MNSKAVWIASGVLLAVTLVASTNSGCGDDSDDTPDRVAHKGEVCQSTNDCAPGLACLPSGMGNGGVCVVGVFNIAPTGKECVIVECQQASECCDPPPAAQCESLRRSCQELDAGMGGNPNTCAQYEKLCICDASTRDCVDNKCVVRCASDTACSGTGMNRCVGGKCVQCANNNDCGSEGSGLACLNGKCQSGCQNDADCPGFERCVQNRCIPSGCQTNRECVAATRNVESVCGPDGKCIVPCQSDPECGNPKDYAFYSCLGGRCVYMGCESEKDCSLFLGSGGSTGGPGTKQQIVCRSQAVPNSTTKP